MFGAHRRGFDWKGIAEVLHVTQTAARAAFWSKVKQASSKDVKTNSKENPRSGADCAVRDRTSGQRILRSLSKPIGKRSKGDRRLDSRAEPPSRR